MAADLSIGFATFPTPLGGFTIAASRDGVVATSMDATEPFVEEIAVRLRAVPRPDGGRLVRAGRELERYFAGRLRTFSTPVDLRLVGTAFARGVLEVTRTIPFGEMWTYGDVAARAGRPGAGRGAGSALRRCPIELFVPCHRVVPAGPGLGRYGGEEDRRLFLLRFEGAI
jgi:methylated-DNA-[protein]-cysteine S-methyltransferase